MEHTSSILFKCFLLLFSISGLYAQSPCPEYFEYKSDESGVYGLVHVYPKQRVSSITVVINFTVAAQLSTRYLGKIEPLGNDLALIQQFNNGESISYRLHFPLTFPVPRITSISVNNDIVCLGPGDNSGPNQYVTRIGLEHTLYLKNGPNVSPVTDFSNEQNFPPVSFNKENSLVWTSNSQPFFIINNSQIDIDERFRPSKPFNFNTMFYPTLTSKEPFYAEIPQRTTRRPTRPNTPPAILPTTTTQRPQVTTDNNQCGVNGNIDSVPLIYNGMSYNRGEWPWVVAIFKRKDIGLNYICSGTLISNSHVVTAAHCMHRKTSLTSITDIVVKAGVYNILDWGDDDVTVTRVLSSAILHEAFNSSTLANDILLLTFTRPVEFNVYIKAACLWSGNADLNLIVGEAGVVTGWGVSELGPAGKGEPRMVRMPIVGTDKCRASKPEFHKLTSPTTLCAGDRNGAGPCLGDSGGGLYMRHNGRWKLRGIVSVSLLPTNGDMTCNLNEYIVFTDAAQYVTWINDKMKT